MGKRVFLVMFLGAVVLCNMAFAEVVVTEYQEGRYVLEMMEGRALKNIRVPAMILDTAQGIVWTCQNLQDGRPLWVKADLGRNKDKQLPKKKYFGKMLMWQDSDLRMPAIVLDTETGVAWTCQNIIDGKALWIQNDLPRGTETEISREAVGRVRLEDGNQKYDE